MIWPILLLGATAPAPVANPLVPAESGKLQCYHPDASRRTCRSIASYRKLAIDRYDNRAVVLLNPSPPIVMTTITPVTIKQGAVCGTIRSQDIESAEIMVAGQALSGEQLANARTRIVSAMSPLMAQEICTTYKSVVGTITAVVSVDGKEQQERADTVAWIDPSDGYVVAP